MPFEKLRVGETEIWIFQMENTMPDKLSKNVEVPLLIGQLDSKLLKKLYLRFVHIYFSS